MKKKSFDHKTRFQRINPIVFFSPSMNHNHNNNNPLSSSCESLDCDMESFTECKEPIETIQGPVQLPTGDPKFLVHQDPTTSNDLTSNVIFSLLNILRSVSTGIMMRFIYCSFQYIWCIIGLIHSIVLLVQDLCSFFVFV